jgi:putative transposase
MTGEALLQTVEALGQQIGIRAACQALGVPRCHYYRARARRTAEPPAPRKPSPRALSPDERSEVRALLNSPRFQNSAPRQVYAGLLEEGRYLCSYRSMYRILHDHAEVRERRNQLRRPHYHKPELLATGPNQVWSWDITRLRGPVKGSYFYLYVVLDIYSRCVVGWMVANRESAALAEELVAETCRRHGIQRGQLTLHADRGKPMTAKPLALLLADLGVTKSHSRPNTSNDNPFSEAQFKTMKYQPTYPERFSDLHDARSWVQAFIDWYNYQHYHSGIGLLTPADVHFGRAQQRLRERQAVLSQAYQQHPERFVRGLPHPPRLPEAVWINPPARSLQPPAVE